MGSLLLVLTFDFVLNAFTSSDLGVCFGPVWWVFFVFAETPSGFFIKTDKEKRCEHFSRFLQWILTCN